MSHSGDRRVTTRPLLFNDPVKGEVFEIPAGEPCVVFDSVEQAKQRGLLPDEQSLWAARTNVQRGYRLAWLRGLLRGVAEADLSVLGDGNAP